MKTLIVIPARFGSTRFPQKPLHDIAGKTLLSRVTQIAQSASANNPDRDYVVATDHELIEQHAREIGAPVVMTSPDLPSGTDRALAAVERYAPATDFIINLQGDAPFTPPSYIDDLIQAASDETHDVVTPVVQLSWAELDQVRAQKAKTPFSGTSCVMRADGEALWFSKQILPAIRKEDKRRSETALSPVWRHIGLYGYHRPALERFVALPEGHYESLEGLEQLRFLENGMRIKAVRVKPAAHAMWGVDTPEDAAHAEALINQHGEPVLN